ncbi:MAG: hypothetical protein ACHQJ6_06675 [Candidatus Berkiellales bacterium]
MRELKSNEVIVVLGAVRFGVEIVVPSPFIPMYPPMALMPPPPMPYYGSPPPFYRSPPQQVVTKVVRPFCDRFGCGYDVDTFIDDYY